MDQRVWLFARFRYIQAVTAAVTKLQTSIIIILVRTFCAFLCEGAFRCHWVTPRSLAPKAEVTLREETGAMKWMVTTRTLTYTLWKPANIKTSASLIIHTLWSKKYKYLNKLHSLSHSYAVYISIYPMSVPDEDGLSRPVCRQRDACFVRRTNVCCVTVVRWRIGYTS